MFFHYTINGGICIDLVVKAQQFLAEEQELVADFLLDMESIEGSGKDYAKAAVLWSAQITRVAAIKDAFEVLGILVEEEELDEYSCECGEIIFYVEHELRALDVADQQIDCGRCGSVYRV